MKQVPTFTLTAVFSVWVLITAGCDTTNARNQSPGCTRCDGRASADSEMPVIPNGVVGRSITWENRAGEPGAGGMAKGAGGVAGRKGSACIPLVKNGETATLMDIDGCGVIRHIWITIPDRSPAALRNMIVRMYWENNPLPSVEVPLGDFFGVAHGRTGELLIREDSDPQNRLALPGVTTAYTTITLGRGFNCYFAMPFARHARVTVENDMPDGRDMRMLFFQIDYELREALPADIGLFHAQFRRQNPTVEMKDYVLLDVADGPGYFLGCVIGIRPLADAWWGEGEMKFYMDGDSEFPTICGTGTEDYFNAAWGMGNYQTPWHGCPLYLPASEQFPHGLVSLYRFHEKDPVYFRQSFRAEIQQIGYKRNVGLFERSDDWSSVAYWYQRKPITKVPPLPDRETRTAHLLELKP